jgi:hypothetical protein
LNAAQNAAYNNSAYAPQQGQHQSFDTALNPLQSHIMSMVRSSEEVDVTTIVHASRGFGSEEDIR